MTHAVMKKGEVNAYILNLMAHYDTIEMNEYELTDRIRKRYRGKIKPRPKDVRRNHIQPLIDRHWLEEVSRDKGSYREIVYRRIGLDIGYVRPVATLHDQFEGNDPEMLYEILKHCEDAEKDIWYDVDYETFIMHNSTFPEYEKHLDEQARWYGDQYDEYLKHQEEQEKYDKELKEKLKNVELW
jgi:hypothetical protein